MLFLAGADLGAEFTLGSADANADTFAAGSIGGVKIGVNATGIVIGAGLEPMGASCTTRGHDHPRHREQDREHHRERQRRRAVLLFLRGNLERR